MAFLIGKSYRCLSNQSARRRSRSSTRHDKFPAMQQTDGAMLLLLISMEQPVCTAAHQLLIAMALSLVRGVKSYVGRISPYSANFTLSLFSQPKTNRRRWGQPHAVAIMAAGIPRFMVCDRQPDSILLQPRCGHRALSPYGTLFTRPYRFVALCVSLGLHYVAKRIFVHVGCCTKVFLCMWDTTAYPEMVVFHFVHASAMRLMTNTTSKILHYVPTGQEKAVNAVKSMYSCILLLITIRVQSHKRDRHQRTKLR